jgi:polygalacturonase
MWLLHPIYSEQIVVRGVAFSSHGPNGDGIDVDSCRNVRISDCLFDTQDDCIVIKSGRDADGRRVGRPTEDVVITNCTMYRGHGGVVIGSETSGGIARVTATNIVCKGTDRGVRIKTARGRGGVVRDLRFANWVIEDAGYEAIQITAAYQPLPAEPHSERTPALRDIALNGFTLVNARRAVEVTGLPEQAVERIHLTDIRGTARTGLAAVEAHGLELRDVHLRVDTGPALDFQRCRDVAVDGDRLPGS